MEGLHINFLDIFVKLMLSFFVPTLIGKALRELVRARGPAWRGRLGHTLVLAPLPVRACTRANTLLDHAKHTPSCPAPSSAAAPGQEVCAAAEAAAGHHLQHQPRLHHLAGTREPAGAVPAPPVGSTRSPERPSLRRPSLRRAHPERHPPTHPPPPPSHRERVPHSQTLSSARTIIVETSFGTMMCVIVATLLVHVLYLVFNSLVVLLMRIPPSEAACVVIMASQKARARGSAEAHRGSVPQRTAAPVRGVHISRMLSSKHAECARGDHCHLVYCDRGADPGPAGGALRHRPARADLRWPAPRSLLRRRVWAACVGCVCGGWHGARLTCGQPRYVEASLAPIPTLLGQAASRAGSSTRQSWSWGRLRGPRLLAAAAAGWRTPLPTGRWLWPPGKAHPRSPPRTSSGVPEGGSCAVNSDGLQHSTMPAHKKCPQDPSPHSLLAPLFVRRPLIPNPRTAAGPSTRRRIALPHPDPSSSSAAIAPSPQRKNPAQWLEICTRNDSNAD